MMNKGGGFEEKTINVMYLGPSWNRIFTPSMSKSMANQGNKSPLPALLKIDQAITFNSLSKDLWNMSVMSLVDT